MTSTYSNSFRFELPADGDRSGTWGQMLNTFMGTLLEDAITGVSAVSMTSDGNYTLVTASGATDEARRFVLNVTSTVSLTATRNVVAPAQKKQYIVYNNTTGGQSIQIIASSGTGITIPNGKKRWVYFDGTDFVDAVSDLPAATTVGNSTIVTETGTQTLTNKTLTSPTITGLSISDSQFTIKGSSDTTKLVAFEVDGLTTATTRTITVPDANLTIVGTATTQTLTNKTLTSPTITVLDNAFTIQDNSDATKQAQFQASGITTATTRTYTLPNADGTLLLSNGSGASLTGIRTQGVETIWMPAGAMVTPSTDGADASTTNGTNVIYKTLDFDQTTSQSAQFQIAMPKSWDLGNISFIPYWTASAGTATQTCIFTLQATAVSNDDVFDASFSGGQSSSDALIATGDLHVGPESTAFTPGGTPAAGDILNFKILRDVSDTLAADAKLIGIKILYTTNAGNDT